jgi:hypothetical protein
MYFVIGSNLLLDSLSSCAAFSCLSLEEIVEETSTASGHSITVLSAISIVIREPDSFVSRTLCTSWSCPFGVLPCEVAALWPDLEPIFCWPSACKSLKCDKGTLSRRLGGGKG